MTDQDVTPAEQVVSVLIVDDQAPFRTSARTVVGFTDGFEVVGEAETGEAAVEQVEALKPKLVLMDINMPGMGGIAATRKITTEHPDVRVVLLSTYDADDLPADARTCGAAGYVHKEQFGPDVLTTLWEDGAGAAGA